MARPPRPKGYRDYVLEGEQTFLAIHRHWMILAKPGAFLVGSILLTLLAIALSPKSMTLVGDLLIWVSLGCGGYFAWRVAEWRNEYFIATDKRLVLAQGFIDRNIATMPLMKVTDLSFQRSVLGRLLGYGKFVFESAGQDQAMREIAWIPNPDETYRLVVADIFAVQPNERDRRFQQNAETDDDDEDDEPFGAPPASGSSSPADRSDPTPPFGMPRAAAGAAPAGGTAASTASVSVARPGPAGAGSAEESYSRAIPVGGGHGPLLGWEQMYESDDIRRRRRAADTRPVPRSDDPGDD
ncbi:MAG TPA: PH domain-containing protein [Dermatophilaceae bacterium]|nr:PH domain-containing protein [Dermatophilaceae bacterium]